MRVGRVILAVCLLSWVCTVMSCAATKQAKAEKQPDKANATREAPQGLIAAARAQCEELAGKLEELKASMDKLAADATRQAEAQSSRAEGLAARGKEAEALAAFNEAQRIYSDAIEKLEGISARPADLKENMTIDIGHGATMEFVLVRPGSFDMGSSNEDSDEVPVHRVNITKPFYMGKYVVTQKQWQAVMGNNPSRFYIGENMPVEYVSWPDSQEFLAVLAKVAPGHQYRMPTEAEWEYACRAGTTGKYYFDSAAGMGTLHENSWTDTNSHNELHPVGEKLPNPLGLYDMHGDVWEWCSDWYASNYYQESPADDPQGPSGGQERVLRGGSFANPGEYGSSADRGFQDPMARRNNYGLRVVFNAASAGAAEPAQREETTAEDLAMSGRALIIDGKYKEAEFQLQRAVQKDPGLFYAWSWLGWSQYFQGKSEDATASFEKCTSLNPSDWGALDGLGWVAKRQGRTDDAIKYWEELGSQGDYRGERWTPTAPEGLGDVAMEKGDYQEALRCYKLSEFDFRSFQG